MERFTHDVAQRERSHLKSRTQGLDRRQLRGTPRGIVEVTIPIATSVAATAGGLPREVMPANRSGIGARLIAGTVRARSPSGATAQQRQEQPFEEELPRMTRVVAPSALRPRFRASAP